MRRHDFRAAALEQAAELSGIDASLHKEMYEEELRAQFPEDMVAAADEAKQFWTAR
jgi:hypothetical protein